MFNEIIRNTPVINKKKTQHRNRTIKNRNSITEKYNVRSRNWLRLIVEWDNKERAHEPEASSMEVIRYEEYRKTNVDKMYRALGNFEAISKSLHGIWKRGENGAEYWKKVPKLGENIKLQIQEA